MSSVRATATRQTTVEPQGLGGHHNVLLVRAVKSSFWGVAVSQVNRIRASLGLIARNSSAYGLAQSHLESTRPVTIGLGAFVIIRTPISSQGIRLQRHCACCDPRR